MRLFSSVLLGTLLFGAQNLSASSLTLVNDSPYTLSATIVDATGQTMATVSVNAGSTYNWSNWNQMEKTEEQPMYTQTPFSVNWTCASGAVFTGCTQVEEGAMVSALNCIGPRDCPPADNNPMQNSNGNNQSNYGKQNNNQPNQNNNNQQNPTNMTVPE